jgi:hypothetical protein
LSVESLPLAQARAAQRPLDQYLVSCPGCARPSALHLDATTGGAPRVVRFVCPNACPLDADAVLACLTEDRIANTA